MQRDEALLAQRVVSDVKARALAAQPGADINEINAADLEFSMLSEVVISSIDDRELKRVARDMLELVNTLISISPVTDEDMQQMLANRAETGHAYKNETHKLEALAELWRLKFKDMHFTTGTDFQEIIERWKSNLTSVAD